MFQNECEVNIISIFYSNSLCNCAFGAYLVVQLPTCSDGSTGEGGRVTRSSLAEKQRCQEEDEAAEGIHGEDGTRLTDTQVARSTSA